MHPSQQSRTARLIGPLGLLVTFAVSVVVLSGFGALGETGQADTLAVASLSAVAWHLLAGGSMALAYLAGAIGIGRCVVWLVRRVSKQDLEDTLAIQAALGLAAMLSLSHLLGCVGLMSGDGMRPRVVAWSVVLAGIVCLLDQIIRGSLRPEKWKLLPPWSALFGPVIGVLIVSACSPPGWLWESEHGAYDVRSYHLQLAREWAIGPRIGVSHHNVYGALPSSIESAYAHLAQLMPGESSSVNERVLGGDGEWVIACQLLHTCVGILAGVLCAAAVFRAIKYTGLAGRTDAALASTAGLLLLATPWTIVCASLAYNEAAVLALGVAALLAAMQRGVSPLVRGTMVGLFVGGATCAKPTALLLLTPVATFLLLQSISLRRAKECLTALTGATIAGLCVLAPWLIRNAVDTGNPVFPFAPGIFGTGHFTAEQVARHAANHRFVGGISDRVATMFSSHRGFWHPQFGISMYLTIACAAIALASSHAHRLAAALVTGLLVGVGTWGAFTHVQSRFLLPLLAPAGVLVGLGLAAMKSLGKFRDSGERAACPTDCHKRDRATKLLCLCVSIGAAFMCVLAFVREREGHPARLIPGGVGVLTGMIFDEQLNLLPPGERAATFDTIDDPVRFVNLALRPQDTPHMHVYLLGDGAPLYYFGATGGALDRLPPVVYHTTWDRSLFGDAIVYADSPDAWTTYLRSRGITHVLIDLDEITRLSAKDKYYDPRVSIEHVHQWASFAERHHMLLRRWTRSDADASAVGGQLLFELGRVDPRRPGEDGASP